MQTVSIQISQLLQEFADQDLHCLPCRLYAMLHQSDSVDFERYIHLFKIASGGNFYMLFFCETLLAFKETKSATTNISRKKIFSF